jgi:hypothetical protein
MDRVRVWRTIRNSAWLLGGVGLLGGAFFLWIGMQVHERIMVEQPLEQPDVPIEPEKVRFSPTLGMMTDIVPELNLKKNINTEEHDPEFKGADFIKEQSNKWTLQLMSVSQESVIKNYLAKRPDREKFYYFRYVEKNKSDHFVLTYGVFASVSLALQGMQTMDFGLPESIKSFPQRFYAYKPFVVDSNSDEDIVNLSNKGKVYQVRLRSVPVPVDIPVVMTSPLNQSPIDSTVKVEVTTTPRGNTVATPHPNVAQPNTSSNTTSQSNTTPVAPTPETPVLDPFN